MKTLWLICLASTLAGLAGARDWDQFGGPAMGHADGSPHVSWSAGKNVLWSVEMPGKGWSSPVIAGETVWVTTALDGGRSLRVVAMRLSDGGVVRGAATRP